MSQMLLAPQQPRHHLALIELTALLVAQRDTAGHFALSSAGRRKR